MASTPAKTTAPARTPVRTLQALANIPTPTTTSEVAYLMASIHGIAEQFALIVDVHGEQLRKQLGNAGGGRVDSFRSRAMARHATAPIRQAAERIRGGGSSAVAAFRRFVKVYADLINPRKRDAFDFRK